MAPWMGQSFHSHAAHGAREVPALCAVLKCNHGDNQRAFWLCVRLTEPRGDAAKQPEDASISAHLLGKTC